MHEFDRLLCFSLTLALFGEKPGVHLPGFLLSCYPLALTRFLSLLSHSRHGEAQINDLPHYMPPSMTSQQSTSGLTGFPRFKPGAWEIDATAPIFSHAAIEV